MSLNDLKTHFTTSSYDFLASFVRNQLSKAYERYARATHVIIISMHRVASLHVASQRVVFCCVWFYCIALHCTPLNLPGHTLYSISGIASNQIRMFFHMKESTRSNHNFNCEALIRKYSEMPALNLMALIFQSDVN